MTRLVDTFCVVAAAAAALFGAADALIVAPGLAEAQTTSIAVRYSDLNLNAPGARGALERRIAAAARQVCGGEPDIRDLDRRAAFDACRDDATERALAQLPPTRALALAHARSASPPLGR